MALRQPYNGNPLLVDEASNDYVAVRNEDSTFNYFAFVIPTATTPVDGVQATLTTDMTNANADITLLAVNYGARGNLISVTYVDPGANDATLSIAVSGYDITVNLATDGSGAITSTAAQVVAALAANAAAAALVTASAEGDGSGVVEAVAKDNLATGVDVTPGPVGTLAFDATSLYIKVTAQTWKKADFI